MNLEMDRRIFGYVLFLLCVAGTIGCNMCLDDKSDKAFNTGVLIVVGFHVSLGLIYYEG